MERKGSSVLSSAARELKGRPAQKPAARFRLGIPDRDRGLQEHRTGFPENRYAEGMRVSRTPEAGRPGSSHPVGPAEADVQLSQAGCSPPPPPRWNQQ